MLTFINCLQKNPYKAVGIEDESKHCSAPGSRVQTDIFFPHYLAGKGRISVPTSCPAGLARLWLGAPGSGRAGMCRGRQRGCTEHR